MNGSHTQNGEAQPTVRMTNGVNGKSHVKPVDAEHPIPIQATPSPIAPGTLDRPNTALYVTKDHRLYQKDLPFPTCPPLHCIIHIRATGICGSEIHFWKHGRIGDCCVEEDCILGHESAGQVVEVGEGVRGLKVGDRVSVEPQITCMDCSMCLKGRYNQCPNVVFSGSPPADGTMRRFVAHPARYLHPIPDSMPYSIGALIEPLAVAYQAVRRASPYLGQPVFIAGAGPIGLAMALNARAAGCHPICISDLEENRLEQAKSFGFDKTIRIEKGWSREETADRIMRLMGTGCRPEIVFECTGSELSINSALYAVEQGGTLLQIGCGKPEPSIALMAAGWRELSIVTSFRYNMAWPTVIRLAAAGVYGNVEQMITHTLPMSETLEAFEICVRREEASIKVQIVDE